MPIFIPSVPAAQSRTTTQLSAAPQSIDIAFGAAATFYDSVDPTKRYVMNAAQTLFVLVNGNGNGNSVTVSGVTYDSSTSKLSGFAKNGIAYSVTYPTSTSIVVSGGAQTITITLDSQGRVIGKVVA